MMVALGCGTPVPVDSSASEELQQETPEPMFTCSTSPVARYIVSNPTNVATKSCGSPSGGTSDPDWWVQVKNVPLDYMPTVLYGYVWTNIPVTWRAGGNGYPGLCDGYGRWPMIAYVSYGGIGGTAVWDLYVESLPGYTPQSLTIAFVNSEGRRCVYGVQ
jgi:hypothetical protein